MFPFAGVVSMVVSFVVTFFISPFAIRYFNSIGIRDCDQHKKDKRFIPTSAGIPVMFGIIAGVCVYLGFKTFITKDLGGITELLASLSSIIIIAFAGFFDDLNTRQEVRDGFSSKMGIKQWQRPLITIPAAIPLMVINAGVDKVALPFIGVVNLGLFFPLVAIPIGVVGAANMINLIGGFNGVEAGMGLVYTTFLGVYAYFNGSVAGAAIFLIAAAALLAILRFNWYPARILSGDSIQYLMGGVVACGAIIGNIEKVALITLLPFMIEFVLKLRSGLKASCLGILQSDGTIKCRYSKVYSIIHIIQRSGRWTEKQIAVILMLVQVFFCFFALIISSFF